MTAIPVPFRPSVRCRLFRHSVFYATFQVLPGDIRCTQDKLESDRVMMRDLREKTKIIMIVVALAFVGLMVFEWGMDISGSTVAQQTGELGRVNGEPINYEAYNLAYQQLYENARQQLGVTQLSR